MDLVAGDDQLLRPVEVASQEHRTEPEPMEHDRPVMFVSQPVEDGQALDPLPLGEVGTT